MDQQAASKHLLRQERLLLSEAKTLLRLLHDFGERAGDGLAPKSVLAIARGGRRGRGVVRRQAGVAGCDYLHPPEALSL
jgi:hypothetical protein